MREQILDNPDEANIANGGTLNAIYDLITNPQFFGKARELAQQPLPGRVVKQVRFRFGAAAATDSLADLVRRKSVPRAFEDPALLEERTLLRAIVGQVKKDTDERGLPKSETLAKLRAELDRSRAIFERLTRPGSDDRLGGEKYLKALYGFATMLESPSHDKYLADADSMQTVPLRDMVTFMHSFNVRIGPSQEPEVRGLYHQLYADFSELRQ
jgi:hypothetical protein